MTLRSLAITSLIVAAGCGPQEALVESDSSPRVEGSELRSGVLLLGSRPTIEYEVVDGQYVFEGDMAVPPSMVSPIETTPIGEEVGVLQEELLAASTATKLWPNGVVPYTISSAFNATMRSRILSAIDQWNTKTVAKFVPRNGQGDYVTFQLSSVGYAWASVGRIGGQQFINLVANPTGVIVHEMGHTLGFLHEHTRPDRGNHVIIHWGNIRPGFEGNFYTYSSGRQAGPYDIDSIMHYPSYEFSRNGYATITRLNWTDYPQNYTALSAGDAAGVAQLYGMAPTGEIIVDSNDARNNPAVAKISAPAAWVPTASTPGYFGTGYYFGRTAAGATDDLVFSFYLGAPEQKTIDAWWTTGTNRSTAAPFKLVSQRGNTIGSAQVNQQLNGSRWNKVGTWSFPAGWNEIRLSRAASGDVVIADAVRVR